MPLQSTIRPRPAHARLAVLAFFSTDWIRTLEGGHIVCPGDWIITGVKGEKYPCKPDIFEATYGPVDLEGVNR